MVQKYSLPLLLGVVVALVFANAAPDAYSWVAGLDHHGPHLSFSGGHFKLLGHALTLHFLVNDIFMVFFFGLAAKEVTEALLPGGALSPFKKAMSPLLATMVSRSGGGACSTGGTFHHLRPVSLTPPLSRLQPVHTRACKHAHTATHHQSHAPSRTLVHSRSQSRPRAIMGARVF